MKRIVLHLIIISLFGIISFLSCKKENSCEGCFNGNKPPIAIAGPDHVITLPTDSVLLDGSASGDPDGMISGYQWTKLSGPASFNIDDPTKAKTVFKNLVEGTYLFELKVTDDGGLSAKDTVQVTVNFQITQPPACDNSNRPTVNAQLIPIGILSQARSGMAVATAGNKILFAGGLRNFGSWNGPASRVDIYDITQNTWSTAELCVERNAIAAVANGNKIFFGGGEYGDGTWPVDSVDIYDVSTNTWTVSHLSCAGHSIAAAAVGNKVFFAGGDQGFNGTPGIDRAKQVDIYDLTSNTWSTAQLSETKRAGHSSVAIDNKIYFAGGEVWNFSQNGNYWYVSNKVDVYDNATNTWATSSMQEGKLYFAGITSGSKIIWAGGLTGNHPSVYTSCAVEVKDINTGSSSIQYLFKPAEWFIDGGCNAVIKDNKIIFCRQVGTDRDKFDIYDIGTNTWSIGILPQPIPGYAAIISVNNTIYIAGGVVDGVLSNQVWKLEF